MTVRAVRPGDAAAIAAIYTPFVRDSAVSFELDPPDAAEMRARIDGAAGVYPWLAVEVDGAVRGYSYAAAFKPRPAYRHTVETTVYIAADARRRGLGKMLYRALLDALAGQGYAQAIASISLPNMASIRLHERLGFTAVGIYRQVGFKHGAWHDVGVWQRALACPASPPDGPSDLTQPR